MMTNSFLHKEINIRASQFCLGPGLSANCSLFIVRKIASIRNETSCKFQTKGNVFDALFSA